MPKPTFVKDCCRGDDPPGPISRILNAVTVGVLALLGLATIVSLFL